MQIRLFMGSDFEAAARILGTTWHAHHGSRSYWQGADELCVYLAQSDFGYVALDDAGELLGLVLLRSPRAEDHNESLSSHWLRHRTELVAVARALGINAQADAQILLKEQALMQWCAARRGTEGVGVIDLLIISADARGMGVGRALLREGFAWLEEHGCQTLRLVTDDGCDWEFYEHVGMERVDADVATVDLIDNARPSGEGEAYGEKPACEHLDVSMFVYEGPLREVAARLA